MKLALFALVVALSVPSLVHADAPTEAQLVSCVGNAKAGWTPTVFSKLKGKMTPAEVGKLFPGAEAPSKYGFATVKLDGCAGASEAEFYFAKPKGSEEANSLQSVRLKFDPALTADDGFYQTLVKVLEAKFGKIKKRDQIEKHLITWVNPKFKTAQLTKMSQLHGGEQLQLEVGL